MKVVIAHYHLRTGGVSSIIERQIEALLLFLKPNDITLLSSTEPLFDLPDGVNCIVDESLEYYSILEKSEAELVERTETAKRVLSQFDEETVLHFHNPTLGKSLPVTAALSELVKAGRKIVYHCHDFAEERPAMMAEVKCWCRFFSVNEYKTLLYPKGDSVSYVVINRADQRRAYLPDAAYLSNPVMRKQVSASRQEVAQTLDISAEKQWLLYPVRAITRKNIGEILLLALLFPDAGEWLITLAPQNPTERPQYEEWLSLAENLRLPILFNVAVQVPFDELLATCDRVITTSVQEGFGLAYLEPWLVDKPVVGRKIPQVVSDFTEVGIQLSSLYDAILVPNESGEWCDFALLTQKEKLVLVEKLGTNALSLEAVLNKNETLYSLFEPISTALIVHNREVITRQFSLSAFSHSLQNLYNSL